MKSDSSPKGTLRAETGLIQQTGVSTAVTLLPEQFLAPVADLKQQNWKKRHVPRSNRAREVEENVDTFGFKNEFPILVSSRDRTVVLDGDERVHNARRKGIEKIPAIVVPCADERDEVDVVARIQSTTRIWSAAQLELFCFEYGQYLSAQTVKIKNKKISDKKKNKKSLSEASSDRETPAGTLEQQAGVPLAGVEVGEDTPKLTAQMVKHDSRKLACDKFGVTEWNYRTIQELKNMTPEKEWEKVAKKIRDGVATAKGLLAAANDAQENENRNTRKAAAAKLPEVEGWRQGLIGTVLKNLPEGTTFRLIITRNQNSIGEITPFLATDGHLLMAVDNWKNLHAAQETLEKLNCHIELLAVHFPQESDPKSKIQGQIRFALLASQRKNLQERLNCVMTAAAGETAIPTGTMVQVLAKAVTVANERILLTDGTAEEFIMLKKLCRRPLVIAASAEIYDAGLVEIAQELSPPAPEPAPAPVSHCLVSPETLPATPEDTNEAPRPNSDPPSEPAPPAANDNTTPAVPPTETVTTNEEVV